MKKKSIKGYPHILYEPGLVSKDRMIKRSKSFNEQMNKRRSIREFSEKKVPKKVIESIIQTASTAPSGAHKQPWTFCAVSNQKLKREIRAAAEAEEKENYNSRMSERWIKDLEPFATNWEKEFLTTAPWLIVIFKQVYEITKEGERLNNYYVNESVGIACGLLITAIHNAGLQTLTHTPSPMNFLAQILNRPQNERAYLLMPVGYAKKNSYIPDIERKPMTKVCSFFE